MGRYESINLCQASIDSIREIVSKPKYKDDIAENSDLLSTAANHLESLISLPSLKIDLNQVAMMLELLASEWHEFDKQNTQSLGNVDTNRYKQLFYRTMTIFNSIRNNIAHPNLDSIETQQNDKKRAKGLEYEQDKLEDLANMRAKLMAEYESAVKASPVDNERVNRAKKQLNSIDALYIAAKHKLEGAKTELDDYKWIKDKIGEAFNHFSTDNHLDVELKKLQCECICLNVAIGFLIASFIGFYVYIICSRVYLQLYWWRDYLMYTMSIPLFIALLWLFVYLKNRASKLSIEISSKLYHIHYIEGLMKMINDFSKSNDESLERNGQIVNSIVDAFLKNISQVAQTSEQISSLEKMELRSNPYWKVITELKEIIKLIKNE